MEAASVIIHIPQVPGREEAACCRQTPDAMSWTDGGARAGGQAHGVKQNLRVPVDASVSVSGL